ncbi:MAG: hypothetical protein ACLQIB_40395 [Isosphaeraceae bacterium]
MDEPEREKPPADDSRSDSPREQDRSGGEPESQSDRSAISTTDPVVASGVDHQAEWREHPDATSVAETSDIDRPMPAYLLATSGTPSGQSPQEGPKRDQGNGRSHRGDQAENDTDEGRRTTDPSREKSQPSLWLNVLISAGVALVAGMIGAGIILFFFAFPKSASNQSPTHEQSGSQKTSGAGKESESKGSGKESDKGSGADETSQLGSAIPGFTLADDADALRRQIDHLSERIDQLGQQLDTQSRPRDAIPPDLRTLQIKVGDLTSTIEEIGNLPSRFRRLESRFEDLRQNVKMLRDQLTSSQDDGATGASARKAEAATAGTRPLVTISPPTRVEVLPDAAWAQGVALFKSGYYPEANNVFRQLQVTRPTDARVWYYSALADGMTSGDWTRSARELVERGLECERAGTPEKNQIDVALIGLTEAQGRNWLNAYRDKVNLR